VVKHADIKDALKSVPHILEFKEWHSNFYLICQPKATFKVSLLSIVKENFSRLQVCMIYSSSTYASVLSPLQKFYLLTQLMRFPYLPFWSLFTIEKEQWASTANLQ